MSRGSVKPLVYGQKRTENERFLPVDLSAKQGVHISRGDICP
jgi:hypothetical protein